MALPAAAAPVYKKQRGWVETMLASRDAPGNPGSGAAQAILDALEADFPVQWDWLLQDAGTDASRWFQPSETGATTQTMIRRVIDELGTNGTRFVEDARRIAAEKASPGDSRWLRLYEAACLERRRLRLASLFGPSRRIVFAKHHNLGGSHYAFTEALSDAGNERHFHPGAALCVLTATDGRLETSTLLSDAGGVIRDPSVSHDGARILFAWKKSDRHDDFHLYDIPATGGTARQITFGTGFADYEGAWLPAGDIVFNSTRCVQTVASGFAEASNLYTCDKDGRFLRRLTFDQVHDNFPAVLDDGRVIYTRWEYNDRGQTFAQPLFQMNPDGSGQALFYGGNSWFPTSILHARGIPGTQRVLAIAGGHHAMQAGKFVIIDPSKGRVEAAGVQLIAPVRETRPGRDALYGQQGELFQNPYPLGGDAFIAGYHPLGWRSESRYLAPRFKLYHFTADGRRELLAADPVYSCTQPVLLEPRPAPPVRASSSDPGETMGTFSIQDIYAGRALPEVPRGTIARIRVVALEFRAAGIGYTPSDGPAGTGIASTPPSIDNGSWDTKIVLGEATVHDDGSAFFQAPARTPLYFQAVDRKGRVVQTMRSWTTLQPGENAACIGCHEDRNAAVPAATRIAKAMRAGAEPLRPFNGPPRAFSFAREIQPILDRHCISCHHNRSRVPRLLAANKRRPLTGPPPAPGEFSLLGTPNTDPRAKRNWSDAYLYLTGGGKPGPLVNWIGIQSVPQLLPPRFAGSATSRLLDLLENGHGKTTLSQAEIETIACWIDLQIPFCGDYREAAAWQPAEYALYDRLLQKRRREQEARHASTEELIAARDGSPSSVRMRIVDASGTATPPGRPFRPGDRIEIVGPPHMAIRLAPGLSETLVYSPEGFVRFPVPLAGPEADAYPPGTFSGTSTIAARPAEPNELAAWRDVATNPYDPQGISTFFPHTDSIGRFRRFIDFGCMVSVDRIALVLRSDGSDSPGAQPDAKPMEVLVRFSDGLTESVALEMSAKPQQIAFPKRDTTWVEIAVSNAEIPPGSATLGEVRVFGREGGSGE